MTETVTAVITGTIILFNFIDILFLECVRLFFGTFQSLNIKREKLHIVHK